LARWRKGYANWIILFVSCFPHRRCWAHFVLVCERRATSRAQERQDSGSPIPSSNPVARRSDPVSPHRPECPCAGHMMRKDQTAAHALGLHILVLETGSDPDYDATFENLVQRRVGPLIVGTAAFFLHRGDRLALMAARQAITARGLMSYGTRLRMLSPGWHLHGPHSQRCQAGRFADLRLRKPFLAPQSDVKSVRFAECSHSNRPQSGSL
jgi:hypothetical protein